MVSFGTPIYPNFEKTYEEGDLALFESGAIVFHIAERHAGLLLKNVGAGLPFPIQAASDQVFHSIVADLI